MKQHFVTRKTHSIHRTIQYNELYLRLWFVYTSRWKEDTCFFHFLIGDWHYRIDLTQDAKITGRYFWKACIWLIAAAIILPLWSPPTSGPGDRYSNRNFPAQIVREVVHLDLLCNAYGPPLPISYIEYSADLVCGGFQECELNWIPPDSVPPIMAPRL